MKKTYIAPAVSLHKLHVESDVLVMSNRALFGNKKKYDGEGVVDPDDPYLTPYVADEDYIIDVIEGDDWSTL